MLYYKNLDEIVFARHEIIDSDELVVVSGYVGPNPISRLEELPFSTTVIYGMYASDGISANLHSALQTLNNRITNATIMYSTTPIHSKCYAWRKNGQIVHALIGSANFTLNGLRTPYREILAETTKDTFSPLNAYINTIIGNSVFCDEAVVRTRASISPATRTVERHEDKSICKMFLYNVRTNEVQEKNGLNWGLAKLTGSHVHIDDANIPISTRYIMENPDLFPEKLTIPREAIESGRIQRHNENIEIIWDDGTTMTGLLEGNNMIDNRLYPKQICSFPAKHTLGQYIRQRLGVQSGYRITRNDLWLYGRDTIDVSLQGEGIYYLDFSV